MHARLDRHALHEHLWRRANRLGMVTLKQAELAEQLGISMWHMSRIMHELADEGRLRVVGRAKHTIPTFKVEDPARWREAAPAP